MSNWSGVARTNYFKVKDPTDFLTEFCQEKYAVEIVTPEPRQPGGEPAPATFALLSHSDNGGWEDSYYDEEKDVYVAFEIATIVATFLVDDEVAVFIEVGGDRFRYLTGFATAINSKGEERFVNLDGIYELAKELGSHITNAGG